MGRLRSALIAATLVSCTRSSGNSVEQVVPGPDFTAGVKNVTVPEGRDVTLSCSVVRLGSHKVAWIHYDRSAILTVQNNVITRNPRIGVSHDGHSVWNLHIKDVERSDEGQYMCQINTARAKTRLGNLHVVVPPRIVDSLSSSDMVQTEGSNVTLECVASGSPEPEVVWRREDARQIRIAKNTTAEEVTGPILRLWKVSRMDMGAYMCIAKNGVPPAVSKRIELGIDFTPMIWVPAQLVGVYHGDAVTLTCFVEAHPASLNYWEKDGVMIHQDDEHNTTQERGTPQYKVEMKLTILSAGTDNFGKYSCVAKNPRGQTDGSITLYARAPPTTVAPPTTPTTTSSFTYKVLFPENKPGGLQGENLDADVSNEVDMDRKERRRQRNREKKRRNQRFTTESYDELYAVPFSGHPDLLLPSLTSLLLPLLIHNFWTIFSEHM